jgi:hypothetical protein
MKSTLKLRPLQDQNQATLTTDLDLFLLRELRTQAEDILACANQEGPPNVARRQVQPILATSALALLLTSIVELAEKSHDHLAALTYSTDSKEPVVATVSF